ncbi:hypothetical protein [Stygiolobus sp. RP850M]|uniref:hypothetical protein n=1 Tax=Stygiolobus sp. RP850M TaxID=3133137 RepID=UPI00307DDA1B
MRAQSEYIGFIFALIIVVALLIPLMFYLLDVSSPSSKPKIIKLLPIYKLEEVTL